eukprot:m.227990 g.227990  ORF g.227990 m.227990 type:complete len:185 (+) comp40042_c0_seq3:114-668(+)
MTKTIGFYFPTLAILAILSTISGKAVNDVHDPDSRQRHQNSSADIKNVTLPGMIKKSQDLQIDGALFRPRKDEQRPDKEIKIITRQQRRPKTDTSCEPIHYRHTVEVSPTCRRTVSIKQCLGTCTSFTMLSPDGLNIVPHCVCCQPVTSSIKYKNVVLSCPDISDQLIVRKVATVNACECRRCS